MWASNLADAPPPMTPLKIAVNGSPAFGNSEAAYQFLKAQYFDRLLHRDDLYGEDAIPRAEGRNILASTFTASLSGEEAKKRGGKGSFTKAIVAAFSNAQNAQNAQKVVTKAQAERLYDRIDLGAQYSSKTKKEDRVRCTDTGQDGAECWRNKSEEVMRDVLRAKFSRAANPKMVELLLATGDRPLFEGRRREGSVWEIRDNKKGDEEAAAAADRFRKSSDPGKWGLLGKLLMQRRDELRGSRAQSSPPPQPPRKENNNDKEKESGSGSADSPIDLLSSGSDSE